MKPEGEFAVIVFAMNRKGEVPLVRGGNRNGSRSGFRGPLFWKLPGGGNENGETPEECAIREFKGETGLDLKPDSLQLIVEEPRTDHTWMLYTADIISMNGLLNRGREDDEEVKVVSSIEIGLMDDFLRSHKRVLEKYNLI